jgi:hypothetical protein
MTSVWGKGILSRFRLLFPSERADKSPLRHDDAGGLSDSLIERFETSVSQNLFENFHLG